VSTVSSGSASVTWEAPGEADRNGIITSYLVNVTLVATSQSFTINTTGTALNLTSLQSFTSYTCRVAARTRVGLGPFSVPVSFLTEETGMHMVSGFQCCQNFICKILVHH
jgi:hypothetical protein